MDLTGGDVEADARADRYSLITEGSLPRSREKGDRLLNWVRVQQDPVARLQPLLRDEKPLGAVLSRDQMLGGETAGTGYDRDSRMVDAT